MTGKVYDKNLTTGEIIERDETPEEREARERDAAVSRQIEQREVEHERERQRALDLISQDIDELRNSLNAARSFEEARSVLLRILDIAEGIILLERLKLPDGDETERNI